MRRLTNARLRRRVFIGGAAGLVAISARTGARAAQFNYKMGYNQQPETPLHVRMSQMWEAVEHETGGCLSVELFPNSMLGGEIQMLGQLRQGALEFMALSGLSMSGVVPAAAIESVPFAFKNRPQVYTAMDGALGRYIRGEIEAKGIHVYERAMEVGGFYQITNNVRPLHSSDDLAGLKIRTGNGRLQLEAFQAFGASVISMAFNEVYTSLQTHVVDGQCNPYALIEAAHFFEVQKYVSEVNLNWACFWVLQNRDSWNALPADIQAIVVRNQAKYALLQRRDSALFSAASQDKLVRQGMIRNVTDPASFRAKLANGPYMHWKQEFGPTAWSALEEYSGKIG